MGTGEPMIIETPFRPSEPRVSSDRARIPVNLVISPWRSVSEITLIVRRNGTLDSTAGNVNNVRFSGELIFFDVGTPYPGQSAFRCAVRRCDTLVAFLHPEQPELTPIA
jgi:hypothetical protein